MSEILEGFTSASRLVRRLEDQAGATFKDKECAVRLLKSFHDWSIFNFQRQQLDERRKNDPKPQKVVSCNFCD